MTKLYYYDNGKKNAGDFYSPWLLKKLGIETTYCDTGKADLISVGSIIGNINKTNENTLVWGSGFHNYRFNEKTLITNPNNYIAVRGKLTLNKLKELGIGDELSPVLGDPGLLISDFYNPNIIKKYKIGIIPHYLNYDKISKYNIPDDVTILDIRCGQNIEEFIDKLKECEFIISSSLHGIIFAHSYNIPAIHLLDNSILESKDCFKYKDYYSVLDIEYKNELLDNNLNEIIDKYLKINDINDYLPSEGKIRLIKDQLLFSSKLLKELLLKPKYNVVLCAIAKNEHLYINEWVEHHIKAGFNKIYLFDNDEDNNDFVAYHINKEYWDKIIIFNRRGLHVQNLQQHCYQYLYDNFNLTFNWCMYCDLDEFLDGTNNISAILKIIPSKFWQVRIKWRLFGDDDLIERDISKPVFGSFKNIVNTALNRELTKKSNLSYQGKFIIRGGLKYIKIASVHFASIYERKFIAPECLPSGKECKDEIAIKTDYSKETLYLNHYMTKTLKEFIDQKVGRGDAVFEARNIDLDYYWRINKKTPEKLEWLKNNGYIV